VKNQGKSFSPQVLKINCREQMHIKKETAQTHNAQERAIRSSTLTTEKFTWKASAIPAIQLYLKKVLYLLNLE